MEYKMTFQKHFSMLGFTVFTVTIVLLGMYYLQLTSGSEWVPYSICVGIVLASLGLHFTYYLEDRGKSLRVFSDQFELSRHGTSITYSLSQLNNVTVVGSKNIEDYGIPQIPTESYFYAKLTFDDDSSLYLTSLLIGDYNNVKKMFPNIHIHRKYGLLNTLYGI